MNPPGNPISPEDSYESAKRLQAAGRLPEAEQIYRRLLETAPNHLGLLQRLTDICHRTGRTADAADFARKAVAVAPDNTQMFSNLGVMLYRLGAGQEALPYLERALSAHPDSAAAHTNLGMVLASLNRRAEALDHFTRAAALAPGLAAPHNNIGNVLSALQRYEDAVAAFRQALVRDPGLAEAWSNLGNALFHLRRYGEAIPCFQRALARNPGFAAAHYNWGTVLGELGAHDDAAEHYCRALEIDPNHVAACNNLGRSLNALSRPQEALAAFDQALALDPRYALAHAGKGNALLFLGRMDEARASCEQAARLAPDEPAVHRALSEVKKYAKGDPDIAHMESLARRDVDFDDAGKAELYFALFKACADIGDHARAFECLVKGNAAKHRLIDYDEAANLDEMKTAAATFSQDFLAAKKGGNASDMPVFIFGMPRSGTTLIEQILASHPDVFGAGEASDFGRTVLGSYRAGQSDLNLTALTPADLDRLGGHYVREITARVPAGKRRFTDKMPANFRFAGLIHLALPNAHLIHVQRDPLDTCFSCYSKLFNGALDYTYDLAELGRYWRAYDRLMAHWREVLPAGIMLEIRYEDLVGDLEAGARKIVAHCGLAWDTQCLSFHQTERPVITASTAQVRQPIYKTAIGRFKPYQAWLGPLRAALDETENHA